MQRVDTLIVGSGPAGSTLARRLAGGGVDVLLIDKETHPRHKPCAGGIPERTVPLLPGGILPVAAGRVEQVALDGAWTGRILLADAGAYVVERADLDRALCETARDVGARVETMELRSLQRDAGGYRVETDAGVISCQRICVCDGVFSPTAKALGLGAASVGFCLETVLPMRADLPEDARHRAVFSLSSVRGGYAWAFPREDAWSVGIGGAFARHPRLRTLLERFIARTPELTADPAARVFGGMIPEFQPLGWYAQDGAFLLGDAARLVDPLTGEGIYYALASAHAAADAILSGEKEGAYSQAVREQLLPELSLARKAADLMHARHPWWIGAGMCLPAFRRRAHWFVELLSGRTSYTALRERYRSGASF